jgi:hypothetical protein
MSWFYNFARPLLPTSTQLAWSRVRIERGYHRHIAAAKSGKDHDKVEALEAEMRFELDLQSEEEASYLTRQLLRSARRLHVPIPPVYGQDGAESEQWYQGSQTGRWCLSLSGIRELREEIRPEQKARHERRAQLVVWISAFTGIIGAITGLVAVIRS